jgi:hypothetical protein
MQTIRRPLWRAFGRTAPAARHARKGGIAVLFAPGPRILGALSTLYADWAIRAIEAPRSRKLPAQGLVEARIPADWVERVREWLDRDSGFPGATHAIRVDCTRCAACCVDNAVALDGEDRARFRASGVPALAAQASRRMLPLLKTAERPCVHLEGVLCGIYELRPNMCREFPPGTEQCLFSREEVFGTPFPPGR